MTHLKRPLQSADSNTHSLKRRGLGGTAETTHLTSLDQQGEPASVGCAAAKSKHYLAPEPAKRDCDVHLATQCNSITAEEQKSLSNLRCQPRRGVKRPQLDSINETERYTESDLGRMQDNSHRLRGLLANIAATPDKRRFSTDLEQQIQALEQEVRVCQEEKRMGHANSRVCIRLGKLEL